MAEVDVQDWDAQRHDQERRNRAQLGRCERRADKFESSSSARYGLAHDAASLSASARRAPHVYRPRFARAERSGLLDNCMEPRNGWSSSRIRKIAPETESAPTMTVALRGAKRPKLMKMTVTQKIRITRNGSGIELPV